MNLKDIISCVGFYFAQTLPHMNESKVPGGVRTHSGEGPVI